MHCILAEGLLSSSWFLMVTKSLVVLRRSSGRYLIMEQSRKKLCQRRILLCSMLWILNLLVRKSVSGLGCRRSSSIAERFARVETIERRR